MLVIRLARTGRTKYPTYRIVAAESKRAATGRFVEVLGHYNPHTKELVIKREQIEARLGHGAQPSNSVIKLLQREGLKLPAWAALKTKAPKKVAEAEAVADNAAADSVAAETPAAPADSADAPAPAQEAEAASADEPAPAEAAAE